MFWPDFGSHLHCRMGRDIVHTDRDPNSIPSSYLSFRMFFCVLSCVTHTHSSFFLVMPFSYVHSNHVRCVIETRTRFFRISAAQLLMGKVIIIIIIIIKRRV